MTTDHVSPFAPTSLVKPAVIDGVRIAAVEAGIRYQGRTDLMLVTLPEGTTAAGVVTQSKTRSAPVEWCVDQLQHGSARALVVNSGNANAFTGQRGYDATRQTAEAAAEACRCTPEQVFLASTGVIGEPMDAKGFTHLLAKMAEDAKLGEWEDAARAIMTTDTFPKVAARQLEFDGSTFSLAGIAKGAGMIAPDMATMLAFIFTDVAISKDILQHLISRHVETTFNSITVDGDTSTSDTVLVFATNKPGQNPITSSDDPRLEQFSNALKDVMMDLALAIVSDGEGLTKQIKINVTGAQSEEAAKKIGLSIANSPLVKTAFAAEDPNWGRVIMAVGKSGEAADRDKLEIKFGSFLVAEQGEVAAEYIEDDVAGYMKNQELELHVDIGIGDGAATVWTCDLTHDYVTINAAYRT